MKQHRKEFKRRYIKMLADAHQARKRAFSYRDFKVGACALGFNPEEQTYQVFLGANAKPEEKSGKICAEQVAIMSARAAGFTFIVGIIVVGQQQPDDDTKIDTPTLPPCKPCRIFFRGFLGSTLSDNTVIVTVNPETEESVTYTVKSLLATFNGGHK